MHCTHANTIIDSYFLVEFKDEHVHRVTQDNSTSIPAVPLPSHLDFITASQSPHQWQLTELTLPPVLAPTLYQPPAATAAEIQRLQASLGALQPSSLHHLQLAPASHTLPTLPSKLSTKVHNGEFIDFSKSFTH